MREKTCCFTGHRELPTGLGKWRLAARLEKAVVEQIEKGVRFLGSGVHWDLIPSRPKRSSS